MNRIEILVIVLAAIGLVVLTSAFWIYHIEKWRIRWILLEHETARIIGREPRDIDLFGDLPEDN